MLLGTNRNFLGFDENLISYVDSVSSPESAVLAELRQETLAHPLAICQVTHRQGLFLQLMVKAMGAKKVMDVGTFTGYSALCMAMAIPEDGWLVGMEVDENTAQIARRYWEKAGVIHKTDLRVGPAADSMQALLDAGHGQTFDLLFIDADKPNYPTYWELGIALARPGGMLIYDNTLLSGSVPQRDEDAMRQKLAERWPEEMLDIMVLFAGQTREFNEKISNDPRADVLLLPFEDGLTIAVKGTSK
ncbi:class I SAM-dependent methyltransferase [Chloroflexota bacterium]